MKHSVVSADFASMPMADVFGLLESYKDGISLKEVERRRLQFGWNEFQEGTRRTRAEITFHQFKSPLVYILLAAGLATLFLAEYTDALVISIVVVLNVAIGVYQEGRAEEAFEKLRQSQKVEASVLRAGQLFRISAKDLVPGDVIELNAGEAVPADARIFKLKECTVSEAALTGEWVAVEKNTAVVIPGSRITEQGNMLFKGTLVSTGLASAVVVRTGHATEVGKIANDLGTAIATITPFQKSVKRLAFQLGIVIILLSSLLFVAGLYRGESLHDMLLLSIAVAVAALPEGLPIAVTVVLAIGLESILRRGGLVKNLVATETLGSTTVIITDKTGTLTQAKMSVGSIVTIDDNLIDRNRALNLGVLASDAFVEKRSIVDGGNDVSPDLSEWHVEGRPVERAIVLAGLESGITQEELWKEYKEVDFSPFNSKRRYASRLLSSSKERIAIVSGSPELFLLEADYVLKHGEEKKISSSTRDEFMARHKKLAARGTRFVAIGYKKVKDKITSLSEVSVFEDFVFVGLIGLHDPLRPDVADAIRVAKEAGARVIMATGDFAGTAGKIAEEVGISDATSRVVTGQEFEKFSMSERQDVARTVSVFARMLPRQKLELLRILQGQGEIVAMTGDGINDAPALINADIGIALGSGTEVAKEAADIILLNDSFSIIVHAIEEGRRILDNLKKIVAYLLATSFGEIFLVGGSFLLGMPIPILPVQILWSNVIEEGFMSVAFAFEPSEPGIMKRNPRDSSSKTILSTGIRRLVASIAIVTGILLIILYRYLSTLGYDIEHLRTIMFAALAIDSIFYTFSLKHLHEPVWRTNLLTSRYLIVAFFSSVIGLLLALLFPPLRDVLSLVPLSSHEYLLVLLVGLFNLVTIELAKYLFVRKQA
ncbi:MAG: HAD-IC family P-type ATPase [bacterium]|nr:HAD-IC family P-type ATPase [bacterium]